MLSTIREDITLAVKVCVSWVLTTWGTVTSLSSADVATYLAIAYTSVSLYVLVRDKIILRRERNRVARESDYTTL